MSNYSSITTPQVTVSLLPVTLSLVHIPRSRLPELSRPILKQLLNFNSPFLNLTCNEIELSIFAEDDMLKEFEPIAWKDRQRVQRARSGSKSSASIGHHKRRQSSALSSFQPVEIAFEKWNVLQIDSHEDNNNSGARVRELSAPLASAGISILYQSSYMSDFIFVKETRLDEVVSLLGSAGFGLYSSDPHNLISQMSPLLTPADSDDNASLMTDMSPQDETYNSTHSFPSHRISSENGAVLSRTRSSTCSSLVELASVSLAASQATTYNSDHDREPLSSSSLISTSISPDSASTTTMTSPDLQNSPETREHSKITRQARKALSPTAAPVDILPPDLVCVGLNDQSVDSWSLKIVKLVAFPELISPTTKTPMSPSSPIFGFDETQATPVIPVGAHEGGRFVPDDSGGYFSSMTSSSDNFSISDSSSDGDADDEYFSSSPYSRNRDYISVSTPSLISGSSRRSSRSYPDLEVAFNRVETPYSRLSRSELTEKEGGLSLTRPNRLDNDEEDAIGESNILEFRIKNRSSSRNYCKENTISFFSFTRTAEGSSLTTDVRLLATLFLPHERHMLIGRDDLLEAADRLAFSDKDVELDPDLFDAEDSEYARLTEAGALKCLQIDLHKFGLDKHGLVNRFSRILEENGINHMYSSTFKTANLLVDKSNAVRAQLLLRSC